MADSMTRLIAEANKDKSELLAIVSSMSEAVIAIDSEQLIRLSNKAAGQLLAIDQPDRDLVGLRLWEVVRHEPILKTVSCVLQERQKQSVEVGPLQGRHLDVCVCPFVDSGGSVGAVIVAHDTTQSVRYQELRKEFVANVSHELRTPLTAIKGFAETLRSWALKDAAKAEQYVATIERHANQLSNLVDDLLELSRLESDHDLTAKAEVDLAALVRRVVDLLTPLAQRKRQSLSVKLEPGLPHLHGIADYLERAVSNLIENAIKYTPEDGSIDVSARREGQDLLVQVSDSGIGIPAEDLHRIFERFYRVHRSRSREMGGTGLGLSIVKHVAQAHGGAVEVSSTVNRGSVFAMRLPLPGHRPLPRT